MTFAEVVADVEEYLANDSAGYAFDALRSVMAWPGTLTDAEWPAALALLARIVTLNGLPAVAQLATRAAEHADDPEALHSLGHELIDQRMSDIAASVLARAHARAAGDERVLNELVAALELGGHYADARRLLAAANPRGFLARYLLAFETFMAGDVEEARRLTAALAPSGLQEGHLRARLDRMLARAAAVGVVDARDVRAWRFATAGTFALDGKRHGRVEDSEASVRAGIERLHAACTAWQWQPAQVLAHDRPDSRRLALAVAARFGVACKPVVEPEEDGLFVAYDLRYVMAEVLAGLRAPRRGLLVFAHATVTSEEEALAADFTTLLCDRIVSPWSLHTVFPRRPEHPTGPPTESDEELARRILETPLAADALADLDELRRFAALAAPVAPPFVVGERERAWVLPQ